MSTSPDPTNTSPAGDAGTGASARASTPFISDEHRNHHHCTSQAYRPDDRNALHTALNYPARELVSEPPQPAAGGIPQGPQDLVTNQGVRVWTQFLTYKAVKDGLYYPNCSYVKLKFKTYPHLQAPDKWNIYRDGLLIATLPGSATELVEQDVLPNMDYKYLVKAVDTNDVEYAFGTYTSTAPNVDDLHNTLTKTVVVPATYTGTDLPYASEAQVRAWLEEDPDNLLQAFKEMSFGKVDFTIDYLYDQEIVLPEPIGAYCTNVDDLGEGYNCTINIPITNVLKEKGLWEQYDLFWIPMAAYGPDAEAGGRVIVFGEDAPTNVRSLCHELGHFLGLGHAAAWHTGDEPVGEDLVDLNKGVAQIDLYGDRVDKMGTVANIPMRHFHALHKERMGWLPQSSVQVVTTPGTYKLYPLTTSEGITQLRIPFPGMNPKVFYFLEYRTASGIDAVKISQTESGQLGPNCKWNQQWDGVLMRLYRDPGSVGPMPGGSIDSYLIERYITPGYAVHDTFRNIHIELVSYESDHVVLEITGNLVDAP